MTGSGYINFEAKNVDAIYEHVKKAMGAHEASINSYNRSATPDPRYKNINMEVVVDLSKAASFMNELSGLKEIKSQSYNQYSQREGDINTLKNELEVLNERLHKAVFSAKPDVEVIKLIVTKVTETENKINQLKTRDPMIGKARINISIQQEGYSDYNNRNKNSFWSLGAVVMVIGALVCFIGGLIAGKVLVGRRKQDKPIGN